ncbi:MAG TPA: hypothetical protein VHM02_11080 [Thermoanaerobaculia bacterium]|nr:hypothetical protein [Thermoanaerobaculia bacterium]
MLAFVTLFLGLTGGVQLVELAVPANVARVELRLDGEVVETLAGPPWRAEVDLGGALLPHRLEAVAYAADGTSLDTAEQWLNLSTSGQSGELFLERDESGRPVAARVLWQSVQYTRPGRITVHLDGEELPVVDDRATLPELDAREAHVLSAELEFPDGEVVRDHRLFGGAYGEETQTELTAVALEVERRRALRRAPQAEGLLTAGGRPARVAALDRGGFDLVVVADRSAVRELERMRHVIGSTEQSARLRALDPNLPPDVGLPDVHAGMDRGDRLFFVRPQARKVSTGTRPYAIFDLSQPLTGEHGGIPWLLTHRQAYLDMPGEPQRLGDAIANAGMFAAANGRARAVLLLVGPDSEDHSQLPPEIVRRYLAAVGVPLRVWYLDTDVIIMTERHQEEAEQEEAAKLAAAAETGVAPPTLEEQVARVEARWDEPAVVIQRTGDLLDAADDLGDELERQRVVWIEGRWLPQEVEVAAGRGVRLPD